MSHSSDGDLDRSPHEKPCPASEFSDCSRDPLIPGLDAICDRAKRLTGADGPSLAELTPTPQGQELTCASAPIAPQLDEWHHATVESVRLGIVTCAAPGPDSRGGGGGPDDRSAWHGESVTLAALLGGTADGDGDAFAVLYDRTCSRLYGVAQAVLRDPGFAEEATQEVYLQVWVTAHRFDPAKGSAQAWLTTLAHRRAVDRVRSEQAHTKRVLFYDNGNRIVDSDYVVDEVIGGVERRMVRAGLASLTDRQHEAIALAYYGGLTYRQVAERLGETLPTIKSRIRAGLARLRESVGTV
jgi:RNA polymerase sigma-70 factor (ECF subfamily)